MNTDTSKWREDAELVANRIMIDYGAVMRWVVKYPKLAVAVFSLVSLFVGVGFGLLLGRG